MDDNQRTRLDAHAIQAHVILIATSMEGEVEETKDFVLGYTGTDLPTCNFFIPLNLTSLTDETLADASAFFHTRDVMYAVSLEEHRVPDGTEFLSKRRYQPLPPQPIMASDHLPAALIEQDKLLIEPVETIPQLTAFYTVLESVYDYTSDELLLLFPTAQLHAHKSRHYVGFAPDGTPVTAATAICTDNVVSVWNLSTLDNYRRQRFASLMMNRILVDAANRGCNLSLIYSTPMSFSLFTELGYKLYAMRQWFLPQEIG
jgi:hypothetical protein